MNNKKSTFGPFYNVMSISLLISAVILTIIKPEWAGTWIDAPAWFGGFLAFYFVMASISLRAYANVERILEDIEKREVMAHEDDKRIARTRKDLIEVWRELEQIKVDLRRMRGKE